MGEQSIHIRDATRDDFDQIANIWSYYVEHSIANLESRPVPSEEIRGTLETLLSSEDPFIVACQDGAICGYAYMSPFNERSGYSFCGEVSVYLHHQATRRGWGKRLLGSLIERVKLETSKTQLIAKSSIAPTTGVQGVPSCRLHLSFGFREVGRLRKVGYKFGEWLDVVILQLDLEETSVQDLV